MKEGNTSTKFVKGVSGNPNGRPLGAKSKSMTDKQITEYLGKRVEGYLKEVEAIAKASSTENPNLALRCYTGLINYDFQMRASEYKKWIDREKLKASGSGIKTPVQGSDEEEEEDIEVVSALSLTCIK